MKYFKPQEFPESLSLAYPLLLERLDDLREYIGKPIYPSPAKGALARFNGSKTSMHYAGGGKLSKAIDVFIEGNKFEVYSKILNSNLFTGIGFYFDTHYKNKDWMMIHLDLRDKPLMWYRDVTYHYNISDVFYKDIYKYLG